MIECQCSRQKNICKSQMGQDQVFGGVSVLCWHAAPVANVLWKPLAIWSKVKFGNEVQISNRVKNWCNPEIIHLVSFGGFFSFRIHFKFSIYLNQAPVCKTYTLNDISQKYKNDTKKKDKKCKTGH